MNQRERKRERKRKQEVGCVGMWGGSGVSSGKRKCNQDILYEKQFVIMSFVLFYSDCICEVKKL